MVRSAQRLLDILETLAASPKGLGLSQVARRLSIPKSTASDLFKTLVARDYVETRPDGRFSLGWKLFDVGACSTAGTRLQEVARPIMLGLAQQTTESVFLGTLTPELNVLVVEKVVASHVIRYDAEVGDVFPAYCTAIGKALLAHLPEDRLADYLRRKRPRLTRRTITRRKALLEDLDRVRRSGVAINIEERVDGASAVGAPILAGPSRALGAILVAGPTHRIVARQQQFVRYVRDAALRVSAALAASDGTGNERVDPRRQRGAAFAVSGSR